MFLQVVCLCGLLRLRCRVVGVGHLPLKHSWHPHHWSTVIVLQWWGCQKWQTLLFFCSPAICTCWTKKRFFKMGIVETCHTHKFYRHMFFWFLYFTFLKLPPPPRAAICYSVANHLCSSPTSDHPAAVLLGMLPRDWKYPTLSAEKRIRFLSSESTKTFWGVHQCQIQCKSIDNNWDLCQTAQVVHNAKDEGA